MNRPTFVFYGRELRLFSPSTFYVVALAVIFLGALAIFAIALTIVFVAGVAVLAVPGFALWYAWRGVRYLMGGRQVTRL